jgi:hypothetical protein
MSSLPEPLLVPDHSPKAEQLLAEDDQVRVTLLPTGASVTLAENSALKFPLNKVKSNIERSNLLKLYT